MAGAGAAPLVAEEPIRDMGAGRTDVRKQLATENGSGLAPEPRPATNTEPRLQSLVFFPILSRCPEE
jgi:hypothetical protein